MVKCDESEDFYLYEIHFQERNLMSKYLYRCLQNYEGVELEDVVFDGREGGDEFDKSKNAITLSPQRRPKELVSLVHYTQYSWYGTPSYFLPAAKPAAGL